MIEFKEKRFSEYDAMRSLYVELMKYGDRNKYRVIDSSQLIPILKGNNVVIERFVISTSFLHKDKYRMYLKVGAKAKMPDDVRLPSHVYDRKLLDAQININPAMFGGNNQQQGQPQQKESSETAGTKSLFTQKTFGKGGGGGPKPLVTGNMSFSGNISYDVKELLGDAVKYDKKERSLVLEFSSISDAIKALNILPFGINYNIYLLG